MSKSRLLTLVVATLAAWLFMATPALATVTGSGTSGDIAIVALLLGGILVFATRRRLSRPH